MKKIILCCDGTWNRADQESNGTPSPTNVIKIAYRLKKYAKGSVPQLIYYDQGVGTGNRVDRFIGGATGAGLEGNIHDAYIFLLANYEAGDELYIFGFSRGAFTARSIGGMIRKCGILKRTSVEQYRVAAQLYRDGTVHPGDPKAADFRAKHSITGANEVPIQMIGVWDTVGALGIPLRGIRALDRDEFEFHDTELSGTVKYAYHALAIDERRAPFEPTLWAFKPKEGQHVEQRWFAGVHSDIGGGYAETNLSDIALEWMMKSAETAGLEFDDEVRKTHPTKANPTGVLHESMSGIYRLQRPLVRPIGLTKGVADASQSVDESAVKRWDADPKYRPDNLRDWFRRNNDPRGK